MSYHQKSAWKKRVMMLVVAVLAMSLIAACGEPMESKESTPNIAFKGAGEGEVVATYKGGTVTTQEFDKFTSVFALTSQGYESLIEVYEFKKMLLEQYVGYKLLASKATEEQLKSASEDAQTQLADFTTYKEQDAAFAENVKAKGITDDDMLTYLYMTSAINEVLESEIKEKDVQAEYEANVANYTYADVRHILVSFEVTDPTTGEVKSTRTNEEALARAKEVKAKLEKGGDWTALAAEYSDDPGSKDNGGLYENNLIGQWVPGFKETTFEQELNVVSEPVETTFGYHIIEVLKREVKEFADLDDALKQNIKSVLMNTYVEAFMTEELQNQEINITLPEPEVTEEPVASEEPATESEETTPSPSPAAK